MPLYPVRNWLYAAPRYDYVVLRTGLFFLFLDKNQEFAWIFGRVVYSSGKLC